MTVLELIRELSNMPLNSKVMIETDEGDGKVEIVCVKHTEGRAAGGGWTHLVPKHHPTGAA